MSWPPRQHLQPMRAAPLSRRRWLALWPLLFGIAFVSLPPPALATSYSTAAQMMAFVLTHAIEQYLGEGHDPSTLTPQALTPWLVPPEMRRAPVWERFQLLPPASIISSVGGHRMLAITRDEVVEGRRAGTGRYVIWLNAKPSVPDWESKVWSEWLPEQDAAALFVQHGIPLPRHGLWRQRQPSLGLSYSHLKRQPSLGLSYSHFIIVLVGAIGIWGLGRFLCRQWWQRNNPRVQSISHRQLHRSLISVLEHAKVFLTEADVAKAQELIHHGEFGVALDLICTQLQEHEVPVPVPLLSKIQHAGAKLQMPASTWDGLTAAGTENGMAA